MSLETKIQLDKRFHKKLQARYEKFTMQVGVLNDGPHKEPLTAQAARKRGWKKDNTLKVKEAKVAGGRGTYAGGPVRKTSRKDGPLSIAQISEENRKRMDVNYLTEPFKKKNSDIIHFTNAFFKMASGRATSMRKRCENLMQAVVRNPILRGDYGGNTDATKRSKGFSRLMIDTAQFFKAIRAKVSFGGNGG